MKSSACFTPWAFPALLLALGCGPDAWISDPAAQGGAATSSLASMRFSDWSSPVNVGAPVSSVSIDQGPFVSRDGLTLYLVSNRPGGFGGQDIYVSHRASVDDSWLTPQNLGANINSSSNDASPTLSTDGHRLYFHSNDRDGGFGGTDLYVSRRRDKRDDSGWQTPENLGPQINTPGNERGLTLFEDDETGTTNVYFDSSRPGGLGGVDIYVSTLDPDGLFGPAVLVSELSSSANDLLPGIRRDGLEIFLDSDRPDPAGLRQRDIWVATRASTSDAWSSPVNLTVINSAFGEQRAALSFDGKNLYVASSRPGGLGDNDIYVSTRTKPKDGGGE
jgi:Tol biopolymer transport system component